MSRTDDILEKTKREEPDAKKWKICLILLLGIGIGVVCFCAGLVILDVETYIHDTKEIPTLNEFYSSKVNVNDTSVYFIGDSVVGFSVYPPSINEQLAYNGYNISVYNLFLTGGGYRDYLFQLDSIVKTNPELVVIGVSPLIIGAHGAGEERLNLFYDLSDINPEWDFLISENEKKILASPLTILDYKKYVTSALEYHLGFSPWLFKYDYSVDPIGADYRLELDKSRVSNDGIRHQVDTYPNPHTDIGVNETLEKLALIYLYEHLTESGISVVFVSLPMHPYHYEKMTDIALKNYNDFLESTNVTCYNLQTKYNETYFRDHTHMSFEGAQTIAEDYADIIIQELS